MNRVRQAGQATVAAHPRTPGTSRPETKRILTRVAMTLTALALPLTVLAGAGPAGASTTPALHLGNTSWDAWAASGSTYLPARSGVQFWIKDVTNGAWTTLEYQSAVYTSGPGVVCHNYVCIWSPGGALTAQGASYWVSVPPGEFGYPGYWQAAHPLACGHSYMALSYDPTDGWVSSNVLTEPACPPAG
jgi:hypothetical protein